MKFYSKEERGIDVSILLMFAPMIGYFVLPDYDQFWQLYFGLFGLGLGFVSFTYYSFKV